MANMIIYFTDKALCVVYLGNDERDHMTIKTWQATYKQTPDELGY